MSEEAEQISRPVAEVWGRSSAKMNKKGNTMLIGREAESCFLGQAIPLQDHQPILMDTDRMESFKAAIQQQVFAGAKVLELGGGTGVLSWFAAQTASTVYCVEMNSALVAQARCLLAKNHLGERVEVIHADAFDYLPPERVDIVMCDMLHVGLLREKQLVLIEDFKRRYSQKFPGPLPIFLPEAVVMAVQPLQQKYDFCGYQAPIVQFQVPAAYLSDTLELAQPAVYKIVDFSEPNDTLIHWEGQLTIEKSGSLSALRFISKNVLAVLMKKSSTIDWRSHYMVLPLLESIKVTAGDIVHLSFEYHAGDSIESLQNAIRVTVKPAARVRARHLSLVVG